MIKLLFLSHTGSGEPPMAEFIMKHLVKEAGLSEKIYVSSDCLERKAPLSARKGRMYWQPTASLPPIKKPFLWNGVPMTSSTTFSSWTIPRIPGFSIPWAAMWTIRFPSSLQQPVMTAALPILIKGPPLKKPSRLQTLPVRNSWRNIRTGSSRAPAERLRPAMGRQAGPRERVHGGTDGYKNALYGDGQRK